MTVGMPAVERAVAADAVLRRRRRRRSFRIVAAVVAVVIGVGVGALLWVDRYQPLVVCCTYDLGDVPPADFGADDAAPGSTLISNALGEEFQVPSAPGSSVDMVFGVLNRGHHAVRLLAIARPGGLGDGVQVTTLVSADRHGGMAAPWTAFAPMTLNASDDQTFVVGLTYPTVCADGKAPQQHGENASSGYTGFSLTYEYLGLRHTTFLTLPRTQYTVMDAPFCS